MTDISLYFSNICVLGRMENLALSTLCESMKDMDINLSVHHFGIGQKYYMNKFFSISPEIPDIIISTDLEVFENGHIWNKIKSEFIDISSAFSLKDNLPKELFWSEKLFPFLLIPMIFFHAGDVFNNVEPSLKSIIEHDIPLAIGGINNSGAKCIIKTVMDRYGDKYAEKLQKSAMVSPMPIGAFNNVKKGVSSVSLVPSIYALSADSKSFFSTVPTDGMIALPSYIAVNKRNAEKSLQVLKSFITHELCSKYVQNGRLFCTLANTADPVFLENYNFLYPSKSFIESPATKFYEMYEKNILNLKC